MEVVLAVTADGANTSVDGKLNLLGIFSEVIAPQLPFTLPQLYLVVVLQAEEADYEQERHIRIQLIDADGQDIVPVAEGVLPIPRPPAGRRMRANQIAGLANVTFPAAGDYSFTISVEGQILRTIPLRVSPRREAGN